MAPGKDKYTNAEAIECLEQRLKELDLLDSCLLKLSRRINLCRRTIAAELKQLKTLPVGGTAEISTAVQETTDEVYTTGRGSVINLYQLLQGYKARACCTGDGTWDDTPMFSEKCTELPAADRVFVRLEADAIYIRTPMLWPLLESAHPKAGRTSAMDKCMIFADEVSRDIRDEAEAKRYSFGRFGNKTIHYCTVYAGQRFGRQPVDYDDYERKYIREAITAFLPGGDSALSCSTYSTATKTDLIPQGTYITVTRTEDGVKQDREIVKYWATELHK